MGGKFGICWVIEEEGNNNYFLAKTLFWSLHFGVTVNLHFGHGQFGPCYVQLIINLVPTVNSLMENTYMVNGLHSCHT